VTGRKRGRIPGRHYSTPAERITLNVTISPTGCWEWELCRDGGGYARLTVQKKFCYGHRFAYEIFVGPIPEGLHIDHLCRNRGCVNPEHLQPVTTAVNQHRSVGTIAAINAAKRACHRGHPFDEDNTRIDSRGCRVCRTCNIQRSAAWRAARAEMAAEVAA
jgi:hypothetical protein